MHKKIIIFSLLIVFMLAGCSGSKEGQSNEDVTDNNDVQLNSELIEKGEKIVKTSCIGCHGSDLNGDMGPSLHNLSLTKEEIIDVLIRGKGSMPPITAKDNEEAVAEFLLSLQK